MHLHTIQFCLLLIAPFVGYSQVQIERQVITPWGMAASDDAIKMDASLGEVFIGGGTSARIGFQQPGEGGITAVGEFEGKDFDYSFYPNPVDQILTFSWSLLSLDQAWIELYAADGRLLMRKRMELDNGRYSINVENLANGMLAARIYGERQTILTQLIIKQ